MPELAVRIRGGPFSPEQVAQIAWLHRAGVRDGFLSSLGEPALRILYEHVATSGQCGLFVAYGGDDTTDPLGYICGALDTSALYREFVTRRWWVAWPTLVSRLLSPRRIGRALETLRYARREDADLPSAEVINFVVVPAARGKGVATALFTHLMEWFEVRGCIAVKIVTGEHQGRAHGLYEKVGARLRGRTSIHRGRMSRVYVYRLGDHPD